MNEEIGFFRQKLQERLNPMRYEHSLSVSFTAMAVSYTHLGHGGNRLAV